MTIDDRVDVANKVIQVIASHGRRFFRYGDHVSAFELHQHGRCRMLFFCDCYTRRWVYVRNYGRWRGFTDGGTMRGLVIKLGEYIRTGCRPVLNLGPWPDWVCGNGDMWGYGLDAMALVRAEIGRIFQEAA